MKPTKTKSEIEFFESTGYLPYVELKDFPNGTTYCGYEKQEPPLQD